MGKLSKPNPLAEISQLVRQKESFILVGHKNPEGDAIGSVLALYHTLRGMGKTCEALSEPAVPRNCRFLPGAELVRRHPSRNRWDVLVVLDCDGRERIGAPDSLLEQVGVVVNIDHHHTNDLYGHLNWIDPQAAAVGEMAYHLIRKLKVRITPAIATCLYAAIATDTGAFRFRNTHPSVLKVAAELVALGADPHEVAYQIFDRRPLPIFNLLTRTLKSLRFDSRNGIAWAALSKKDFVATATTDEDTEGFINLLRGVDGCRVVVFFRELSNGRTKVSLRSVDDTDVSVVATQFGGGGHLAAAGCTLSATLSQAQRQVLGLIRQILRKR